MTFFGLGVLRVGEVDREFVVNPTWSQLMISRLNLVVACSEKKVGKTLVRKGHLYTRKNKMHLTKDVKMQVSHI